MSLDVYLKTENSEPRQPGSGIFVRRNGRTEQISRQEWDFLHPGMEPVIIKNNISESNEVYTDNITHNLGKMAKEAGIYTELWSPEELGITKAHQLIDPLTNGLLRLLESPEHFEKINPVNGWGDYNGLVNFVTQYLIACRKYPNAYVSVWR